MLKEKIKGIRDRITGMNMVYDSINTLHYIMCQYLNAQDAPKATGKLRDLQIGDVQLLALVDAVFEKNNLRYWLDSGTLLGAIRHKGFIPWDDDVDICMPREDYNLAKKILPNELSRFHIEVSEPEDCKMARLGIGYKHKSTGLWIDIFPVDGSRLNVDEGADRKLLSTGLLRYLKWYRKNKKRKESSILNKKKKIIPEICSTEMAKSFFTPEFMIYYKSLFIFKTEMIFPLKKVEFEGYNFWCPHNTDAYLKELYGDNYMSLPREGVAHHGDARGDLIEWASMSGIDMNVEISKLKTYLSDYKNTGYEEKIC